MIEEVQVKSVLNKHKKRDDWFLDDYSLNPYSGCSFGCVYCYVKGSRYGENVSRKLALKINACEVLEKQLKRRAKKGEYGIIALSSSTEPYQKVEEKFELTRKLLEIILKYRFPVHILTKSTLVLRDLDLLYNIKEKAILPDELKERLRQGVIITFSISTLNKHLARILEPGAPDPIQRLKTMQKVRESGFLTGVAHIPVLPFISDSQKELETIAKSAKESRASYLLAGALTLFGSRAFDCRTLYYKFLNENFPDLWSKYKSLYKIFFAPNKDYQKSLNDKIKRVCEKYGIKNSII